MEDFISTYGYWALAVGILVEGEAALIAASIAAYNGYLGISAVIAIAFFMTLMLDWGYFFLGRLRGRSFLIKRPNLLKKVERIHGWVERNPRGLMVSFRFIYGFRILIPILIGTTKVATRQFLVFSTISVLAWALVFGVAGYLLGTVLQQYLGQLDHYKWPIIGAILFGVLIFLLIRRLKASKANLPI